MGATASDPIDFLSTIAQLLVLAGPSLQKFSRSLSDPEGEVKSALRH
jgi:hypothetical protein